MIKYKLLNQDLTTHHGFQWEVGNQYVIDKPGNTLCTDDVFHFYESPETAALFNIIHANIKRPVCYSVKIDNIAAFDGLKGGAKKMQLIEPVTLPVFTGSEETIFAILAAKSVAPHLKEPIVIWDEWARNYLNGTRGPDSCVSDAAAYAASAAAAVSDAADHSEAADYAASDAAAYAASAAAAVSDAAADYAAAAAAYAAYAASDAAASADYAASAAAADYAAAAAVQYPDFAAIAKRALTYD